MRYRTCIEIRQTSAAATSQLFDRTVAEKLMICKELEIDTKCLACIVISAVTRIPLIAARDSVCTARSLCSLPQISLLSAF